MDPLLAVGRMQYFPDRAQAAPPSLARLVSPDLTRLTDSFARIAASGRYSNFGPLQSEYAVAIAGSFDCSTPAAVRQRDDRPDDRVPALRVSGEVVTTPFSFAASAHATTGPEATPVFADIDAASLHARPRARCGGDHTGTTAILAVHIYGHPCHHEALGHRMAPWPAACLRRGTCLRHARRRRTAASLGRRHRLPACTRAKFTHCGEGGVFDALTQACVRPVRRCAEFWHRRRVLSHQRQQRQSVRPAPRSDLQCCQASPGRMGAPPCAAQALPASVHPIAGVNGLRTPGQRQPERAIFRRARTLPMAARRHATRSAACCAHTTSWRAATFIRSVPIFRTIAASRAPRHDNSPSSSAAADDALPAAAWWRQRGSGRRHRIPHRRSHRQQ